MSMVKRSPDLTIKEQGKAISWRKLSDLPSTKIKLILDMAGEIFSEMGIGKVSEIHYLLISPHAPLNEGTILFLRTIKEEGELLREDKLEFNGVLEGYSAQTQVWHHKEEKYLFVSDEFSSYIYTQRK